MGNPSRPELHPRVADWGFKFKGTNVDRLDTISATSIFKSYDYELKEYFRLCGLSRSHNALPNLISMAYQNVFRVRVILENSIHYAIENQGDSVESKVNKILSNPFFGCSKKQGISMRMPLRTCSPTKLCANACYAHDVLDAAPHSLVRGVFNGWLAETYENAEKKLRNSIETRLIHHVKRGVRLAKRELSKLSGDFSRRAAIRFSHVGELAFYPEFANALASLVKKESKGEVDCIIYSRHKKIYLLDPTLWIINFTLDSSSLNRRTWIPKHARVVFSAFGGKTSPLADVNFLEHHRWSHVKPKGEGKICPVTAPDAEFRSCDMVKCNLCFKHKDHI